VVGSIVAFIGQSLTRRQTSALSIAQQKADLRKDRRDAINEFLEAAERVYALATTQRKEYPKAASCVTIPATLKMRFLTSRAKSFTRRRCRISTTIAGDVGAYRRNHLRLL